MAANVLNSVKERGFHGALRSHRSTGSATFAAQASHWIQTLTL